MIPLRVPGIERAKRRCGVAEPAKLSAAHNIPTFLVQARPEPAHLRGCRLHGGGRPGGAVARELGIHTTAPEGGPATRHGGQREPAAAHGGGHQGVGRDLELPVGSPGVPPCACSASWSRRAKMAHAPGVTAEVLKTIDTTTYISEQAQILEPGPHPGPPPGDRHDRTRRRREHRQHPRADGSIRRASSTASSARARGPTCPRARVYIIPRRRRPHRDTGCSVPGKVLGPEEEVVLTFREGRLVSMDPRIAARPVTCSGVAGVLCGAPRRCGTGPTWPRWDSA